MQSQRWSGDSHLLPTPTADFPNILVLHMQSVGNGSKRLPMHGVWIQIDLGLAKPSCMEDHK